MDRRTLCCFHEKLIHEFSTQVGPDLRDVKLRLSSMEQQLFLLTKNKSNRRGHDKNKPKNNHRS